MSYSYCVDHGYDEANLEGLGIIDDDISEGMKVCTYKKSNFVFVVFVIDPVTGQQMHLWCACDTSRLIARGMYL